MKITNQNKYTYTISNLNLKDLDKQNFVVFDLESTGLDVKKDFITQFGAVITDRRNKTKKKYKSFIYSPKKISKFIEKLTGVKNSNILKAPNISDVLLPLWKKYKDYVWVAQCGFEFDFKILERILSKTYGQIWFNPIKMDTKVMFSYLHKDLNEIASTDFMLNYYKIRIDLRRHDALNDSIIISKILKKILNEYKKNKIDSIEIRKPIKIKKFYIQNN